MLKVLFYFRENFDLYFFKRDAIWNEIIVKIPVTEKLLQLTELTKEFFIKNNLQKKSNNKFLAKEFFKNN